jgi:hypothetical protein
MSWPLPSRRSAKDLLASCHRAEYGSTVIPLTPPIPSVLVTKWRFCRP